MLITQYLVEGIIIDTRIKYSLGIDVQLIRACSYAILSQDLVLVDSGWFGGESINEKCQKLLQIISSFEIDQVETVAVGIVSPECISLHPENGIGAEKGGEREDLASKAMDVTVRL